MPRCRSCSPRCAKPEGPAWRSSRICLRRSMRGPSACSRGMSASWCSTPLSSPIGCRTAASGTGGNRGKDRPSSGSIRRAGGQPPAFDHEGLARSLTSQGHPCTATTLPFARIELGAEADARRIRACRAAMAVRRHGLQASRPRRSPRGRCAALAGRPMGSVAPGSRHRAAGCRERHDAPAHRGRHGRLRLCRLAGHRSASRDPAGPGLGEPAAGLVVAGQPALDHLSARPKRGGRAAPRPVEPGGWIGAAGRPSPAHAAARRREHRPGDAADHRCGERGGAADRGRSARCPVHVAHRPRLDLVERGRRAHLFPARRPRRPAAGALRSPRLEPAPPAAS